MDISNLIHKLDEIFIRRKSYYDFYKKHNYPYKPSLESFSTNILNKEIEIIIEDIDNQIKIAFKKYRREGENIILEDKSFYDIHTGKKCDGWLEYYE